MNWPKEIVVIGAGNVAWHLGKRLIDCGSKVIYVYARNEQNAKILASELGCNSGKELSDIPKDADLYLLAISDAAIAVVARELYPQIDKNSLLLHTSGATPANVFQPYFSRFGVLYPLQTFSKKRELDFSQVPICVCTALRTDLKLVKQLAGNLTNKVYEVSDEQRLQLHLAAIYVNNFTNYLQFIGESLLNEHGLPPEMMRPLLLETTAKLKDLSAKEAQTGPAIRGDKATIDRHLAQLEAHPHWQEIYQLLSEGIQQELSED